MRDLACTKTTDGLENLLYGDRLSVERAVRDAATVKRDTRNIHACQRHRRRWNRLVATAEHDHRIETMTIDGQLD